MNKVIIACKCLLICTLLIVCGLSYANTKCHEDARSFKAQEDLLENSHFKQTLSDPQQVFALIRELEDASWSNIASIEDFFESLFVDPASISHFLWTKLAAKTALSLPKTESQALSPAELSMVVEQLVRFALQEMLKVEGARPYTLLQRLDDFQGIFLEAKMETLSYRALGAINLYKWQLLIGLPDLSGRISEYIHLKYFANYPQLSWVRNNFTLAYHGFENQNNLQAFYRYTKDLFYNYSFNASFAAKIQEIMQAEGLPNTLPWLEFWRLNSGAEQKDHFFLTWFESAPPEMVDKQDFTKLAKIFDAGPAASQSIDFIIDIVKKFNSSSHSFLVKDFFDDINGLNNIPWLNRLHDALRAEEKPAKADRKFGEILIFPALRSGPVETEDPL